MHDAWRFIQASSGDSPAVAAQARSGSNVISQRSIYIQNTTQYFFTTILPPNTMKYAIFILFWLSITATAAAAAAAAHHSSNGVKQRLNINKSTPLTSPKIERRGSCLGKCTSSDASSTESSAPPSPRPVPNRNVRMSYDRGRTKGGLGRVIELARPARITRIHPVPESVTPEGSVH